MNYKAMREKWAERRQRVDELDRAGVSHTEIGRRFRISLSRVSHILRAQRKPRRGAA